MFSSLWKKEELLWQINCGVEKTAAVGLSDISLDTNIPEGDAYDFLTNTSPTGSLLSGNVSFQQSRDVYLWDMVLCVVVVFLWPRENKGIPGHLSFNTASAADLQCGFRQITLYLLEYLVMAIN